jgi:hypothetical protein
MGWVVSITARPRFTPGERIPGTHCTGGWVGPRAGLDTEDRGKILCPCRGSNPDHPVVQPIVRHYTDWVVVIDGVGDKSCFWLMNRYPENILLTLTPVITLRLYFEKVCVCVAATTVSSTHIFAMFFLIFFFTFLHFSLILRLSYCRQKSAVDRCN